MPLISSSAENQPRCDSSPLCSGSPSLLSHNWKMLHRTREKIITFPGQSSLKSRSPPAPQYAAPPSWSTSSSVLAHIPNFPRKLADLVSWWSLDSRRKQLDINCESRSFAYSEEKIFTFIFFLYYEQRTMWEAINQAASKRRKKERIKSQLSRRPRVRSKANKYKALGVLSSVIKLLRRHQDHDKTIWWNMKMTPSFCRTLCILLN